MRGETASMEEDTQSTETWSQNVNNPHHTRRVKSAMIITHLPPCRRSPRGHVEAGTMTKMMLMSQEGWGTRVEIAVTRQTQKHKEHAALDSIVLEEYTWLHGARAVCLTLHLFLPLSFSLSHVATFISSFSFSFFWRTTLSLCFSTADNTFLTWHLYSIYQDISKK